MADEDHMTISTILEPYFRTYRSDWSEWLTTWKCHAMFATETRRAVRSTPGCSTFTGRVDDEWKTTGEEVDPSHVRCRRRARPPRIADSDQPDSNGSPITLTLGAYSMKRAY
jgi:hypothetical protein